MAEMTIDPSLVTEFLDESTDLLAALDSEFLKLESGCDKEAIQSIFRPIHSIKGNSSFFGFFGVKSLSHEMETVLDHLRKDKLQVTGGLVTLLLEGFDQLKSMLGRLREGAKEVEDPLALEALIKRISASTGGEDKIALLQEAERQLTQMGQSIPPEQEALRKAWSNLRDAFKRLHPEIAARASVDQASLAGRILTLVAEYRTTPPDEMGLSALFALLKSALKTAATPEVTTVVAEMVDSVDSIISAMGFDPILLDVIEDCLRALPADALALPVASASAVASAAPLPPAENGSGNGERKEASSERNSTEKTMRVPEHQIDNFLAYVGELLVVGDMFTHLQSRLVEVPGAATLTADFRRANETFSGLSDQLRTSIMALRKVPARGLLQKAPRLVRDVAAATGKKIHLDLLGEDILIDKSHADLLDAPLTHMVRNAADHGIEAISTRLAAGKTEEGRICVSVEETDTQLLLTISDDGAGLNLKALQRKACDLGLAEPGALLKDEDIITLLFASGVSTATTITDVSGRGVGMDVVRRMVEGEAGGHIRVKTEAGRGTTFQVALPKSVTTQILDGYLVEAAGICFILPMERVQETARVSVASIQSVGGKGRCLMRHEKIYRFLRLDEALGLPVRDGVESDSALIVLLGRKHDTIALAVDAVLGVQQIVLRPIEGQFQIAEAITAAALRGNGSVALVLDVERI